MSGCFEGKQFFFDVSRRPDSDKAAELLYHRDAEPKKLSLLWNMGFDGATAHGPDSKKFFGSFFQKRTPWLKKEAFDVGSEVFFTA
jgi:hypothetical protein